MLIDPRIWASVAEGVSAGAPPNLLCRILSDAITNAGFDAVIYLHLADHLKAIAPRKLLGEIGAGWYDDYLNEKCLLHDPALRRCFVSTTPFVWSELDWTQSRQSARVLEVARAHGFEDGLVVPVRNGLGGAGLILLPSASRLVLPPLERIQLAALAYVLSLQVQGSNEPAPCVPHLTQRERQCLVLAAESLSDAGIAHALGLSVKTVRMHLDRARSRLGVRTRLEAISVAWRTGQFSME